MENNMKLFNTLTKKVETFIPNEEGQADFNPVLTQWALV